MKKRNASKLNHHKPEKGVLHPPMNTLPNLQKVSWSNDRLPEYLWLGLILMCFPRTQGIEVVGEILKSISSKNLNLSTPKISEITNLPQNDQKLIYEIVIQKVNPKIMTPLTAILTQNEYPIFYDYFYCYELSMCQKIGILKQALKTYYDSQSNQGTDLRFCVLLFNVFSKRIQVNPDLAQLMSEYPYTFHDNQKMRNYRPRIRAYEMIDFSTRNENFLNFFWREMTLKTDCNLRLLSHVVEDNMQYREYISNIQFEIKQIVARTKDQVDDKKLKVLLGSFVYVLKIFNDIVEKDLGNSILGRLAFRTILETYINIKYLIHTELEKENIWEEYELYGLGKLKRPLLISRENEKKELTHFVDEIIDVLVNEVMCEEYLDIVVRYFDKTQIKDKFAKDEQVGLYDIFYEYNNNYVHGFWGAVRESAMLFCDNPAHKFHTIPDCDFEQNLSSVSSDIQKIIDKFYQIVMDCVECENK